MKRLIVTFNDGTYLNIPATRMEVRDDAFCCAWDGEDLVAVIEIAGTVAIYMSERGEERKTNGC